MQNREDLTDGWDDEQKLAYLVDIFSELNKLNLQNLQSEYVRNDPSFHKKVRKLA